MSLAKMLTDTLSQDTGRLWQQVANSMGQGAWAGRSIIPSARGGHERDGSGGG